MLTHLTILGMRFFPWHLNLNVRYYLSYSNSLSDQTRCVWTQCFPSDEEHSLFASSSITPISHNLIYDYGVYSLLLIKSYLLFFLGTKSQL